MEATGPVLAQFDRYRPRLTSIAFRMLGSNADAEDAVQETWLRVARVGATDIDNVPGWLTTVTARVCLNMLRTRTARREDPFDHVVYDALPEAGGGPEDEAALADSVSHALLVVLDALDPAERLAFVLHDMFAVPFDEIAPVVERSPAATRQLASRARRRIQGHRDNGAAVDVGDHRRVVDAFFAAARGGDLDGLLVLLDPDLVLRSVGGTTRPEATVTIRGARHVAERALHAAHPAASLQPVLVNGTVGVLAAVRGQRTTLMAFTLDGGLITRIDALVDPQRLARLHVMSP